MYVYCDVLQYVVVGDVMSPVLRIVDVKTTSTTMKHQVLNSPLYVPFFKKNFVTIEINIMTDVGTPFPFVDVKLVVVLEFKSVIGLMYYKALHVIIFVIFDHETLGDVLLQCQSRHLRKLLYELTRRCRFSREPDANVVTDWVTFSGGC